MNKTYNPDTVAPPFGAYDHAVEIPAGARTLHISGQIGVQPDGTIPDDIETQADQAWKNVLAILADAGMGVEDLVRTTAYLTNIDDAPAVRTARGKYLGDHKPASTLLVVAALARPEFLFELEAVAAKS